MFNPQTADWTRLALHCRRTTYNHDASMRQAIQDEGKSRLNLHGRYAVCRSFFEVMTDSEEEREYGTTRANL